jgi:hypothetical protein
MIRVNFIVYLSCKAIQQNIIKAVEYGKLKGVAK